MSDNLDDVRDFAVSPNSANRSGDLLKMLGDDAAKWAAAFCAIAKRKGHDLDEGWMIGWFANAIEHSHQVRAAPVAGSSPAGQFGEPAPRNFTKERPGPGWKISEETERELERIDNALRRGSSPAGKVPPMVPSARERVEKYSSLNQAGVYVRDPAIAEVSHAYRDGHTAAASRLRNPSEENVERVARAICRAWYYANLNTPDGAAQWKKTKDENLKKARAALLAAAEILEPRS